MVEVAAGSFAELLKQYRAAAGLTQEELAERAGLSARGISDLERGIKLHPYPHTVERLVQALELAEGDAGDFRGAARHVKGGAEPTEGVRRAGRSISLASQLTSFIGRQQEVEDVSTLLAQEEVRLLSLTGPGGVGKTRLALQAAEAAEDHFPDGAIFVSLAPVSDSALVASTIATCLKLNGGDQPILDTIADHLREKRLLLLLDNFEHLLEAARIVSQLLVVSPTAKVLVTSRAALHLAAEQEYPVLPLPVPVAGHLPGLETLNRYDAVQLFLRRAGAVKPGYDLTEENAAAIAEICSRVDGLPLGIELIAARVKLFPAQTLRMRLSDRLQLLTGGPRDVPARQQSLRSTIEWSYSLLSPQEQILFARLSVFAGGCSLDAVESVCAREGDTGISPLDALASLVDKNLLLQQGRDEPRFMMLETIREYALERLEDSGEGEALRRRHTSHFLSLAEIAASQFSNTDLVQWLNQLEAEHSNLRGALRWTIDRVEGEAALRFVSALGGFWLRSGYVNEGLDWIRRALAIGGTVSPALRLEAIELAADMLGWLNDYEAVIVLIEDALPTYRQLGDRYALCRLLRHLEARAGLGDLAGAIHAVEESITVARDLGSPLELAQALETLGPLVRLQGDTDRALTLLQEAETISRQHGFRGELAVQLETMGDIAIERGEYDVARSCFVEGLRINRERQARMRMTTVLYGFAALAVAQHEGERAACLFAAEERSWAQLGQPLDGLYTTDRKQLVEWARGTTNAEVWARAWEQGQAMNLEEAVAYALDECHGSKSASQAAAELR